MLKRMDHLGLIREDNPSIRMDLKLLGVAVLHVPLKPETSMTSMTEDLQSEHLLHRHSDMKLSAYE